MRAAKLRDVWVGNEVGLDDRRDPRTFAENYRSLYEFLKAADPSIRVAPGANPGSVLMNYPLGVQWQIQADPAGRWDYRKAEGSNAPVKAINYLQFMTYANEDYQSLYGTPLPADFYVIHLYPFSENALVANEDLATLRRAIIEMRRFMKGLGGQAKDLYIKEMGMAETTRMDDTVLASNAETMKKILDMLWIPDEQHAIDRGLGHVNDRFRLVQKWAWFNGVSVLDEESSGNSFYWPMTSFFKCAADPRMQADCRKKAVETPISLAFKEYVAILLGSLDVSHPAKPQIAIASQSGDLRKIRITSPADASLSTYEVAFSESDQGDGALFHMIGLPTEYEFDAKNRYGKYLLIRARDDAWNRSGIESFRIIAAAPINPVVPTSKMAFAKVVGCDKSNMKFAGGDTQVGIRNPANFNVWRDYPGWRALVDAFPDQEAYWITANPGYLSLSDNGAYPNSSYIYVVKMLHTKGGLDYNIDVVGDNFPKLAVYLQQADGRLQRIRVAPDDANAPLGSKIAMPGLRFQNQGKYLIAVQVDDGGGGFTGMALSLSSKTADGEISLVEKTRPDQWCVYSQSNADRRSLDLDTFVIQRNNFMD